MKLSQNALQERLIMRVRPHSDDWPINELEYQLLTCSYANEDKEQTRSNATLHHKGQYDPQSLLPKVYLHAA